MDETIGPYRIVRALGAGGMGEVFLAEDSRLRRRVALKILPQRLAADPAYLQRFEREAKALAALNHPNIVTIYSLEVEGDRRFLTMEYVEGKTLAQLIPTGGMPVAALLTVAIPLADAIDAAHRHGIVHRDLKPANAMVSDEGRLKVLDFGLAQLACLDAVPADRPTVDALTRAGQVLGTCAYMSPEQAEGRALDARSDIFSLGTILYEMATGRRPFEGATDLDLLMAIRRQPAPPVSELRPTLSPVFDRLVQRCLEKAPDRRVQTARDVHNELEDIRQTHVAGAAGGRDEAAREPRERRVAVLPFANMSTEADQEYFCDGMAEDLINALAHVDGLQVASRTSAFAFKGQNRDVREIGRLLDVGSVLEGSVRRAGNRLRITAQLVRVTDGMHLWSERFDRQLDDVFAIQDEISLTIVDRLKVRLFPVEEARVVKRHTVDPEAHSLYLKGRYFFARRSEGDVARAMACYEQAKAQDPQYPLPYVGLADAFMVLGQWTWLRPRDAFPRAREELDRALALDSDLGEALSSLGYLCTVYDWDWGRAERSFVRAMSLVPRYPLARHFYALFLAARERFDEAIQQSRIYLGLEPLSPIANGHAGQILFHAARYPEAIEQLMKAIDLGPEVPFPYVWLMLALLAAGRIGEAHAASERVSRVLGPIGATVSVPVLVAAGRSEAARRALADVERAREGRYLGCASLAAAHASLGDHEAAVDRLALAFGERDPMLPFVTLLQIGSRWDSVLADARVQTLIRRMGLPAMSRGPSGRV